MAEQNIYIWLILIVIVVMVGGFILVFSKQNPINVNVNTGDGSNTGGGTITTTSGTGTTAGTGTTTDGGTTTGTGSFEDIPASVSSFSNIELNVLNI